MSTVEATEETVFSDNLILCPIDLIDYPKEWEQRSIGFEGDPAAKEKHEEAVQRIAKSIAEVGLLNPITLSPKPDGRYRLCAGRNRLEAYKLMSRTTIEARVFEESESGFTGRLAFVVENLMRQPLQTKEYMAALTEWQDFYVKRHPMTAAGLSAAAATRAMHFAKKAKEEGALKVNEPEVVVEKPVSFTDHVAKSTGVSQRSVQNALKIAKSYTPDQIDTLDRAGITIVEQLKIVKEVKDTDRREDAVKLIASGMGIENAIGRIKEEIKANPKKDKAAKIVAAKDLTDDEWLKQHCYTCRDKLKYTGEFDAAALLYRKSSDARRDFTSHMRNHIAKAKTTGFNPYVSMFSRLVNASHPRDWLACGSCQGSGQAGSEGKCPDCRGAAFKLQMQEVKKK